VKTKKPLPKAAVPALIGVGGLLVLVVGWMLLVSPQKKKIADLKQQAASVQQQIQDSLAQAAAAKSVASAPKIKVADAYKLAKAMPSIADMPDVLLELDQTARDAGVALTTISPSQPSPSATGGYETLQISVAATGTFYSITDLLYRLRNLVWVRNGALEANGRLFSVNNLSLAPAAGGKSVTASLTLTTYIYGGTPAAPAAPAVPAATTTSTDTTATTTTPSSGPSAAGASSG
jgi:Tfp pilus assembly protein PilO